MFFSLGSPFIPHENGFASHDYVFPGVMSHAMANSCSIMY